MTRSFPMRVCTAPGYTGSSCSAPAAVVTSSTPSSHVRASALLAVDDIRVLVSPRGRGAGGRGGILRLRVLAAHEVLAAGLEDLDVLRAIVGLIAERRGVEAHG